MNNLGRRIISGTALVGVVLACLLINRYFFAAMMIFIMSVMMYEFYRLTMGDDYKFSRMLAILSGVVLFGLVFVHASFGVEIKIVSLAIIPIVLVMINSLYVKDKGEFSKFAFIYTGIVYISVPLTLSNFVVFHEGNFNALMLLCFFLIIWCSDIGGYVVGCTLGKNRKKLFPSISPKKSWAGFWGGMAFSIAGAIILKYAGLFDLPVIHCIILAIIMDISGVYGDLFESQWKRHFDVKDSGNIIPGHGGLLDRFDSSLIAMPLGAVYLSLLNLLY